MSVSGVSEGVLSPVITPFKADLAPDGAKLAGHCKWLLSQNVGLAIFGTNSEANSLSVGERKALLDQVIDAGVDAGRMMPGTGACSITDAVDATKHATARGVGGVLMLPPFYYKGVSDDGLYAFYSEVIQRVGDARLKIYLYHIPPVAQVAITRGLIEKLLKDYPDTVVGMKDSSGDWSNTQAMIESFPGFRVFAGSEAFLLQTMRAGGAGCISATANVNPAAIHNLYATWQDGDADEQQAELTALRGELARFAMIPALKATTGHYSDDAAWGRVRPPLVELSNAEKRALASALAGRGFDMPGLKLAA